MAKRRAGLHREISSIFDGVPLPKSGESAKSPSNPAPSRSGYGGQITSNKWRLETSLAQRQGESAADTAASPRPEEPVKSGARTESTERLKVGISSQTSEESPLQRIWQEITSKLLAPKEGVSAARQKTMVILIPALSIVLIFVLLKVLGTAPHGGGVATGGGVLNTASGGEAGIDWQIPEPYPAGLRDPMQFSRFTTANTTEAPAGKLTVTGILFDKDYPSSSSASINGQVVGEGDEVLGSKVVKINKNSVEFEKDGRTWTQRVIKE
ncbi:MAG: hypothetical protein ACYSTF_01635 [Planctomycetota bacterium]|jgi:hypothetical protein